MSNSKDDCNLSKKLAWIQTYSTVIISIGAIFGASGFSVLFFTLTGDPETINRLEQIDVFGFQLFLAKGGGMIGFGIGLIAFGFLLARHRIKNVKN